MPIAVANDMKNMAENIITSYDARVKELGGLVADTHKTLKGFTADRKKMAAGQSKSLTGFVKDLAKNVDGMLKGFERDHKHMSKEQAKSLDEFITNLAEDVGSMLNEFEEARHKMSKALQNRLAKEIKGIRAKVENLLDEAGTLMGEYSSDMARARKAWADMSATLARARGNGVMPRIEAGKNVITVAQTAANKGNSPKKTAGKAQGKKKTATKSKSRR